MDLVELGAVLGNFFEDGKGPSHDQLNQAFARAGLSNGDPAPSGHTPQGAPPGKTKRIRHVLVYATDHDPVAGLKLAQQVVALLRGDGAFAPALEGYAGPDKIDRLRDAFARVGFTLESNGALRPMVIDNLTGTQLTRALQSYVDRINLNPDDAPAADRHRQGTRRGHRPARSRGAHRQLPDRRARGQLPGHAGRRLHDLGLRRPGAGAARAGPASAGAAVPLPARRRREPATQRSRHRPRPP